LHARVQVALDLVGSTDGDDAAFREHRDAMGDAERQVAIMRDHEGGDMNRYGLSSLFVAPRLNMAVGIFSETIIASGAVSPTSMTTFPSMKSFQPVWSGDQPDITGSQIEILVPHQTDVFDTVPSVSLGNHYWRNVHGRGDHHCRRNRNRRQQKPHLPIWLNYTS
jgi:hypothetical protein